MRLLITAAVLAATLGTNAIAGECPADAPEGYQWLSGYVEEFQNTGKVSDWFTGSFAEHPDDIALKALDAFFKAGGNFEAARQMFIENGGDSTVFENAMACADVTVPA